MGAKGVLEAGRVRVSGDICVWLGFDTVAKGFLVYGLYGLGRVWLVFRAVDGSRAFSQRNVTFEAGVTGVAVCRAGEESYGEQ